ncbi:hypothetical protein BG015_011914 [Linnemannia schmuckeri]|uniref:Uncharacterized protein n=1 Tax=Linnemannia schmuckeri TaxID=64567 RepID=A0A9P5RU14_9FUNG|nr:hypothetical protein BG015_011914 [Linnemannia schmuckeri]
MYIIRQAETACAKITTVDNNPVGVKFIDPVDNLYMNSDAILSACWEALGKNETVYQPCVAQTQCKAGEVTIFQGYVARQAATVEALIAADSTYADSGAGAGTPVATTTDNATGTTSTARPTAPSSGANGLVASRKVVAFGAFFAMAAAGLVL